MEEESALKKGSKQKQVSESSDEVATFEELENESECNCDNWDADCKIINTKLEKPMIGYHLMPTCSRNPDENPIKKLKLSTEMRGDLTNESFKYNFKNAWSKDLELKENKVEIITKPFKVCVINDFIENLDFLNDIRQEFNDIEWNLRNMDLYEFFQSEDLKHLTNFVAINTFYKMLENDIMKWVADLTGFNLTHISATCSLYSNTDYLLVHDDQREDRMVAFILYITGPETWDVNNGGALQLLSKDEIGQPFEVVGDISPLNNQFVFFPVTSDSYHQVAEVTSLDNCRLSINGWFHSKIPPIFTIPPYTPYPEGLFGEIKHKSINFDGDLSSWFNPDYLKDDAIEQIQEYFEENSEISLLNFLNDECLNELTQILSYDSLRWAKIGPPNRCCYEIVKTSDLPDVLNRFLQLFQSKQMFSLLERYTDLELGQENASMKFELQKWTPGCYSLLGDYGWNDNKELDLIINFGCKNNSDVIGARTQYVTIEEEVQDALITLEPEENSLNLVYRDTARFTKYFSKLSRCRCFYRLICSYAE